MSYKSFLLKTAELTTRRVTAEAKNQAKKNVRVKTGNLRNTIIGEKVSKLKGAVYTDEDYATSQEYGRPDIPAYGFTPYFRPAAKAAMRKSGEFMAESAEVAGRALK